MNEVVLISLLALFTCIATFAGTIAGFGISTVMIPILIWFLPVKEVLLLVGIIHLIDNVWKIVLFKHVLKLQLLLFFIIPAIVASFIGALCVGIIPGVILIKIIGVLLAGYAIFTLINRSFNLTLSPFSMGIGGALTGLSEGLTGIGGAFRAAFLNSLPLDPASFVATTGAIAFAIDLTRIVTYVGTGIHLPSYLAISFIFLIPASLIGTYLARFAICAIPLELFRKLVAAFIFVMALKLLFFS